MHKYLRVFLQSLQLFLTYRAKIFFSLADNFLNPFILVLALWGARSQSSVSASSLSAYYAIIIVLLPIVQNNVDQIISDMAYSGEVNNFFTKPMSFYKWLLFRQMGTKVAVTSTILPFVILGIYFSTTQGVSLTVPNVFYCLLSIPFSFFISYNFSYFFGMFSFWIDEFWTVRNLKEVLVAFLGGIALPYTLYPESLTKILKFTPFYYMVSWQTRILNGGFKIDEFILSITWSIIFMILIRILWQRVVNKYAHVGG